MQACQVLSGEILVQYSLKKQLAEMFLLMETLQFVHDFYVGHAGCRVFYCLVISGKRVLSFLQWTFFLLSSSLSWACHQPFCLKLIHKKYQDFEEYLIHIPG